MEKRMRKNRLLYGKEVSRKEWTFDEEAWNHAIPIGSGAMGAMVYGGAGEDRLQLNEDTIWYGSGGRDRVNPEAKEQYKKVRELLEKGNILEAEKLIASCLFSVPDTQRTFDTAGEIFLRFHPEGKVFKGYARVLDLSRAVVSLTYSADGRFFRREYFASAAHQVIAVHQETAEGVLPDISMDLSFMRSDTETVGILEGKFLYLTVQEGGNGCQYCVMATAVRQGGEMEIHGSKIQIRGAREATIYLTIRSDFYGDDIVRWTFAKLKDVCLLPYEKVKREHVKEYQSFFARMDLSLRDSPEAAESDVLSSSEEEEIPIPEALEKVKRGETVPGFAENYFQFGRYLLISCSRPGTQPANLQGIWNRDHHPAWGSRYTININTQMNYWPAESCNLSECHLPLFDLLRRMLPNGERVARGMYGLPGFVAHHNTDLFGDCAPCDQWMPATIWPMGAAWLCTHIWRHYEYTLDRDFLEKNMDLMKEACLFLSAYLFENEQGKLVTGPSTSPENTYISSSGESGQVCNGPSMDTEIIRELFTDCLEAMKITGTEDSLAEKLKEQLFRLPGFSIGRYGQIQEWAVDYEEAEPGHRHISQLYALYPSQQITYEKTPELMEAARRTIERRLSYGGGHTGWSRAWIINLWARLRDGEEAWKNLMALWSTSTYPNLFDRHPPFQIDGNFGSISGIAEMLVQDDREGRLFLLPALPRAWGFGYVRGLRARGAKEIDMEWAHGILQKAVIQAKMGGRCILMLPCRQYQVSLTGAGSVTECEEGFSCFSAEAYELTVTRNGKRQKQKQTFMGE